VSLADLQSVRRAYEAFNRRDFAVLDELVDPDVEWHQLTLFPDRATYRGIEELKARFISTQLIEQFGDFKIVADEFIDAGDWIVAIGTVSGHGGSSGLEFSMRFVHLLEMRDGKVVRAYDVAGRAA
jgi:ketosteroid isomerase-like protein